MNNLSTIIFDFKSSNNYIKLVDNIFQTYNKNKLEGLSILNYFNLTNKNELVNIFKNVRDKRIIKGMINHANSLNQNDLKEIDLNYMKISNDLS
jgi:hypothetical protein